MPLAPDDGRSRRIYVANHPPLFYAISALPIRLGQRFGALDGHRPDGPAALLGGIARLPGAGGAPWPAVLLGLAGALLVAALGLLAGAVALLAPQPPAPPPPPLAQVRPAGAAVPPTAGSP